MNIAKGRGSGLIRRQQAILRQMRLWGMVLDYEQEEKSFSWAHLVALVAAPLLLLGIWFLEKKFLEKMRPAA